MNRSDWQELTELRLAEARALMGYSPPLPDGAYYLAGYAVECALKATIARFTKEFDWPDKDFVNSVHTHKLEALARQAKLYDTLVADMGLDPHLTANWAIAKDWDEKSRYKRSTPRAAQNLIDAVSDPTHGALAWIRNRWRPTRPTPGRA